MIPRTVKKRNILKKRGIISVYQVREQDRESAMDDPKIRITVESENNAAQNLDEIPVLARKTPRHNTTVLVRIRPDECLHECRGNVSVSGFYFESPASIADGAVIELLFRLPGAGVWLQGRGIVVSCNLFEQAIGIRGTFLEIEPGDLAELSHWLDAFRELPV